MSETGHANESVEAAVSPSLLVCTGDVMLQVRIEAAAAALGCRLRRAESLASVREALSIEPIRVAVLDLTSAALPVEDTLDALLGGSIPATVLAFYPHVMQELGRRARQAGCALVVARSRFMSDMPALLRRALDGSINGADIDDTTVSEPTAGQLQPHL